MTKTASDAIRQEAEHHSVDDPLNHNLSLLELRGFRIHQKKIYAPFDHDWQKREHAAVSYLEDEWEYSFEGEPQNEVED